MWWILEDDVPPNTTLANARSTKIKVGAGILHTILVDVPPRVAFTTQWQLWQGGYCILPRNSDKWMKGEFKDIPFREWYHLKGDRNVLTLKTYNTSELHTHNVRLNIGVLPKVIMEKPEELLKGMNMFLRLFRRRS